MATSSNSNSVRSRCFFVAHPDGVKRILQENHANYLKSQDYQLLKGLLGNGLVTSEGELWLRQRRLIQPAFHRQRVAEFASIHEGEHA